MKSQNYYLDHLQSSEYIESREEKAQLICKILSGKITDQVNNIADLGSGSGLIKNILEKKWHRSVLGIEYERSAIKDNTNVCVGDVSEMPLKGDSLDLAICNHLYEHIPDKAGFLKEIKRVLKNDGTIYFTVCNKYKIIEPHYRLPFLSWIPLPAANIYLKVTGRGSDYSDIKFYSYKQLQEAFEAHGFIFNNLTWEVITLNPDKVGPLTRALVGLAGALPKSLIKYFIEKLSPQWFLLITKKSHINKTA